ncbi:hypothetical protein QEN19_001420 [Hanseniaspora menglaensis]
MLQTTKPLLRHWRTDAQKKFIRNPQLNAIKQQELAKIKTNPIYDGAIPEIILKQKMAKIRGTDKKAKSFHKLRFLKEDKTDRIRQSSYPNFSQFKFVDTIPFNERFSNEQEWKYLPGDKVVIVNKKFESFGTVTEIVSHVDQGATTNLYTLKEGNPKSLMAIPKMFWTKDQTTYIHELESFVKQEDIRLVYEHPQTKETLIVDDVGFTEELYYDFRYDKLLPKRFVKNNPQLVIDWPGKKSNSTKTADILGTNSDEVLKETFQPESFFKSDTPENAKNNLTKRVKLEDVLKRIITPEIMKHLRGNVELPETDFDRGKHIYYSQLKKIDNARMSKFNEKVKLDIGKRIYENLIKKE